MSTSPDPANGPPFDSDEARREAKRRADDARDRGLVSTPAIGPPSDSRKVPRWIMDGWTDGAEPATEPPFSSLADAARRVVAMWGDGDNVDPDRMDVAMMALAEAVEHGRDPRMESDSPECFVCQRARPLAIDAAITCEGYVLEQRLQVCHRCWLIIEGARRASPR